MDPQPSSTAAAQLASVTTTLTELIDRISAQADARRTSGDEATAQHLYEAERSLRQAARRLTRALEELR